MKRKTAFLLSMLMIVMSVLSNVNFSSTQISTEAASYDIDDYLDIKGGSDYITVSWCKFYYTDSSSYVKTPSLRRELMSSLYNLYLIMIF